MGIRIGATIFILFSILFLPFFCSVILGLIAILYFRNYYEIIGLSLVSDLLYGAGEIRFLQVYFLSTIVTTILFILLEILKTKLKFYQKIYDC